MLRLGLIGYGAIGLHVREAMAAGHIEGVELRAALVRRPRAETTTKPDITHDPDRFFGYGMDVVVECAGHDAVRAHAERVLDNGMDLLVTSVGAFTDTALYERVLAAAKRNGKRLILPSAGIGAIDILSAAAVGGLDSVTVTVRKDPSAWKGTAAQDLVDLDSLARPHVVFDGPVREGARLYPQNVNISAAVALAGIGLDRTRVVIVADPTIVTHVVEVEAVGAFGRFTFMEDVAVSAENRKTGRIVAMALVKTVRQLASTLVVGA
jgi:aspartate dehydrogenase